MRTIRYTTVKSFTAAMFCLVSAFFLPAKAVGQADTSSKPDATFRSISRVDPRTLGMNLQIPLGSYPGRGGTSLPLSISYSSKSLWRIAFDYDIEPTGTNGPIFLHEVHFSETSLVGWSSSLKPPSVGWNGGSYDTNGVEWYDANGTPGGSMARFKVEMPDGSTHELRKDDTYRAHMSDNSFYATGTYYATDGSRMRFEPVGLYNSGTLYMPDGSKYVYTGDGNPVTYHDRNGNTMTYNPSNKTWTDTMGRTFGPILPALLEKGDTTYSVPGTGTSQLNYNFKWRYLVDPDTGETILTDPALDPNDSLAYASRDCQTLPNPPYFEPHLFASTITNPICTLDAPNDELGKLNPVLLSEVVLPNGQSYKFTYNQYGEIDKIVYPTGAYEKFTYAAVQPLSFYNAPLKPANRGVVEHRASSDGNSAGEAVWTYGTQYTTTGGEQYIVATTAPDGTTTKRYLFTHYTSWLPFGFEDPRTGEAFEEVTFAPAASGGAMLRRTLTQWVYDGPLSGGVGNATRNARPERTINVIFEPGSPSALASMSETVYDTAGSTDPGQFSALNPKYVKNYNYVVVDASTARTADISTLYSYFSTATPVTLSQVNYLYNDDYRNRGFVGLVCESRVLNPTDPSDVLNKSQFVYDESAYFDNNYTTTGWEDPNSNLRGNITTAKTWVKETDSWIESHTMYDTFGNVRKVWDTSGDPTRFVESEYGPTYKYAYPTKTKAPAPDPTGIHGTTDGSDISRILDFNTGLVLSLTDARGQTATIEYDSYLRPTRINPPSGGSVSEVVYNDMPNNLWVKKRQQIDEASWAESTTFYDGFGRAVKTRTRDLRGDVVAEAKYDRFGRVEMTSNPYRADASGNPTETIYWSKLRYDNRNRVVETYGPAPAGQTGASLGTVEFGISTLANLVGTYVVATDASGRKSRAISGIYGLMRVDEATAKGGTADQDLGTLANPTQPTFYSYNIKGELVKITQGDPSQPSQPIQYRYFMYDSLGRLIRVRQPEQTPNPYLATTGNPDNNQWTTGYAYDVFGNVVTVTDAKNTVITNYYDKASRNVKRAYSDGTPEVEYFYDGSGLPQVPQFSKGSLTKVISSASEDRFTSFDNHGRLLASEQITDGQTYGFAYKYNLSGGLIEETYPSGRIVRNFLDSDGGLSVVNTKALNGLLKTVATDFDYSPGGNVKKMKLGNGLWETAQFDERLQLKQVGLGTTQTNNDLFKIDYEYGEIDANGNVDPAKNIGNVAKTTTTIPASSFVQTFKYDSINRLTEAKETTDGQQNWTQTFGYDRFGNRTQFAQTVGGTALPIDNVTHPTIDQTNNRFTTGRGYVYDLNGNLIQDAQGRTFTFDGDDKQTEVRDTVSNQVIGQYSYDGSGARVKKYVPSTGETTVFVYDAGGALAAEYSTIVAPVEEAKTSYLTTDHLGSPRVITDGDGEVISRRDFMPFGEELGAGVGPRTEALKYSLVGSDRIRQRFTGYEKDDETGLDFAEARMYQNRHGRFTAPDPLLASASAADPQTFNRYIYTGNNPVNVTDPSGLDWCQNQGGDATKWVSGTCESGWTKINGWTGTIRNCGSQSYCADNNVTEGDTVRFLADGKLELVLSPEQQQQATEQAVQVQAAQEMVTTTNAATLTDHIASAFMTVAENNGAAQLVNIATGTQPYNQHTETGQTIGNGITLCQAACEVGDGVGKVVAGAGGSILALVTGQLEAEPITISITAAGLLEVSHGVGVGGLTLYNMSHNQGPGSRGGPSTSSSGEPTPVSTKEAVKQAHNEVGKQTERGTGKFGSPMRGNAKKGYRLDPPNPNGKGHEKTHKHVNWWDYTKGKRGKGGRKGYIPIK